MFFRIKKRESTYKFFIFFMLYVNIWLTFTFIYSILDFTNLGPIVDHYSSSSHQNTGLDRITRSLYLSSITLLSVGYGDVTPFGLSRAVATFQALIGYLLPFVIVVQFISPKQNVIRKSRERE